MWYIKHCQDLLCRCVCILGCAFTIAEFVWCLSTDYGVDKYDIGTGFGHFAIATQDVSMLF